jgi:hypothetical protein
VKNIAVLFYEVLSAAAKVAGKTYRIAFFTTSGKPIKTREDKEI